MMSPKKPTYTMNPPSHQNALDIFKGAWISKLPGTFADLEVGQTPLFEDHRISWMLEALCGIQGKTILELGPLEGGHTFMMERAGAGSIVAIEANSLAYLKCLIIKEILHLNRTTFYYGNFVPYLKHNSTKFNICLAMGVLYHLQNPVEIIANLSQICEHLVIWTHYYDLIPIESRPEVAQKFGLNFTSEHDGFRHSLYRYDYGEALNWNGFCGGSSTFSYWMNLDDILGALEYFGFNQIRMEFQEPNHPNGPSVALIAGRTPTRSGDV